MPMYGPPRLKRRRIGYGRRNALTYGRSRATLSTMLRRIGAPPMIHTFARPGNVLKLTHGGNTPSDWRVNGTLINLGGAGTNSGIQQGAASAGTLAGTIGAGFSQLFQFSYLQSFNELDRLYDNYRIKMVKVRIDASFNAAPGTAASASSNLNGLPMMHYCIDTDDNTPPTSTSDVLAYTKSRSVRLGDKPIFINFIPRAQGVVNASAVGNPGGVPAPAVGAMLPMSTWLDCQNGQSIPHFGLKYTIEDIANGAIVNTTQYPWVITITPTYILECKNIH